MRSVVDRNVAMRSVVGRNVAMRSVVGRNVAMRSRRWPKRRYAAHIYTYWGILRLQQLWQRLETALLLGAQPWCICAHHKPRDCVTRNDQLLIAVRHPMSASLFFCCSAIHRAISFVCFPAPSPLPVYLLSYVNTSNNWLSVFTPLFLFPRIYVFITQHLYLTSLFCSLPLFCHSLHWIPHSSYSFCTVYQIVQSNLCILRRGYPDWGFSVLFPQL